MGRLGWIAGAVATLACGGAALAQTPADWDKTIAEAKKEGKVTVYSGYISPLTHNAIAEAFKKEYGIQVEYWLARGVELRERARIEQNTGRHIGDVMHNAMTNTLLGYTVDKTIEDHGGLPNAGRVKDAFKASVSAYAVPIFTINYGFLINTSLVKGDDVPKGWMDLLNPKWKGKILSDDPRTSGGGAVMFRMLFPRFGTDYLTKLAAQNLVFARDYQESSRRTARGEFAMYIPYIFSDFPNLKGLPVNYVIPEEGVTYGSYSVSVMKDAPHKNAARLLVNFYLTDAVQKIYAATGHGVMVDGMTDGLPEETKALVNGKPLAPEDFPAIDKMYVEAEKIFGKP
jgi:iron(III) transport system substrate-binding protein